MCAKCVHVKRKKKETVCVCDFFSHHIRKLPHGTHGDRHTNETMTVISTFFSYTHFFPFLKTFFFFFYPLDTFWFSSCSLLDKIHTTHRLSKPCASCHKLFAKHFSTRLRMWVKEKASKGIFQHITSVCSTYTMHVFVCTLYVRQTNVCLAKTFARIMRREVPKQKNVYGVAQFVFIAFEVILLSIKYFGKNLYFGETGKKSSEKPCNKYNRVFLYMLLMAYYIQNKNWVWSMWRERERNVDSIQ